MNSLKKDFVERTLRRLEDLSARAAASQTLSPEFLREVSRTLHTIKGTSQTFGFAASSKLAHQLESLLLAEKREANFQPILLEGFEFLIRSFMQTETSERSTLTDRIRPITITSESQDSFSRTVPAEIFERFADFEKNALSSALAQGKKIFNLHASFDLNDFAAEFKKLRERLNSKGEIIATFPSSSRQQKGKIGFIFYFAADDEERLSEISQDLSAEIDWEPMFDDDDFGIIYAEIAAHARNLARDSGKKVSVTAAADPIALAGEKANLIFDVLLHLARNAVDHGIETPKERIAKNKSSGGTIEIVLKIEENGLFLSVKDDGKGIDPEKLRAKAIEKNLISAEKNLTEKEMLDLIFLHDFSTRDEVTEVSGRGIGLDAVKTMVENVNGKIDVKNHESLGTTFEVFLPNEI